MRKEKDFEFLDHTADLKFIAFGKTSDELFQNSAKAIFYAMLENQLKNVSSKVEKRIELKAENIENLLHDFLSELLFLFETSGLLFNEFTVTILKNSEYVLKATVSGEKFNPEKHEITTEIKAVTYHDFFVEQTKEGWKAQVLCDI